MDLMTLFRRVLTRTYWARRMRSVGPGTVLHKPILVANPQYIELGARTLIRDHARIETVVRPNVSRPPRLVIGDDVNIEQGVHIICQGEVVIENEVSITPYCVIVDTDHPFNDPDLPPKIGARLNARGDNRVRIGQGSFIGAHSVILPGVDIGRGCVVGAGSVVASSVPDYCVVSGAPARILRRFDTATRTWKTEPR
jgi:acetyltransferase-like isoleucine patch superfamily enzyme